MASLSASLAHAAHSRQSGPAVDDESSSEDEDCGEEAMELLQESKKNSERAKSEKTVAQYTSKIKELSKFMRKVFHEKRDLLNVSMYFECLLAACH